MTHNAGKRMEIDVRLVCDVNGTTDFSVGD
jgi:hypothetical protein